jgi:hypothetical protein
MLLFQTLHTQCLRPPLHTLPLTAFSLAITDNTHTMSSQHTVPAHTTAGSSCSPTSLSYSHGAASLESKAIWAALFQNRTLPEFPDNQIPTLSKHPKVYDQMREFLTQRVQTTTDLLVDDMLSDRAADGSPLDPNRDYDDEFDRLCQQYTTLNKAMYTVYATFLDKTPTTSRQKPPPSLLLMLPR